MNNKKYRWRFFMRDVYVIGAHTIKFGRYLEKSVKDFVAESVIPCLKEAVLN
jgi:hypothetical protein